MGARTLLLQNVPFGERHFSDYEKIITEELFAEVRAAAKKLRGARVLHLNATAYGGGVAEILQAELPLLVDLGIAASWQILPPDHQFFTVTKKIHNALQGHGEITDAEWEVYERYNARIGRSLDISSYDYVIIHDPQPAPLLGYAKRGAAKAVWRLHIDTTAASRMAWRHLNEHLKPYAAGIVTLKEYAPRDIAIEKIVTIFPAIDPLAPKNVLLSQTKRTEILRSMGVNLKKPLVVQVSRFDPWKDPLGTIDAFRLARLSVPEAQLVLAGSTASDDPESETIYEQVKAELKPDEPIILVRNLYDEAVNALQRESDVVVQKSVKEGFGLTVAEALWKGTPVVGGRAGGIVHQIKDGRNGFLVESVSEAAEKIVWLLTHRRERRAMGKRGQALVRREFLMPRLIRDELELLRSL